MANPTIAKKSPSHTCDVFEQGCMFCANKDLTIFNPENYPQKVHVAEMTYHSHPGTLYIRETTAEIEKQVVDRPLVSTVGGTGVPETVSSTDEVIQFRGLKQSCSGITFIEEKEEEKREALYKERIQSSIAKRRLWKAYCKHVENYRKMKQLEGVGPRWFQELSTTQTTLLESLPYILKSDTDEKTITSSKRFLSEMGIVPEIEPRYLEKAVIDCEMDPLYFLARIQREIRCLIDKKLDPASQISNFKMKKRKYTVSERIILSSIAHLHMPVFLFKLHLILPPPALHKSETYNVLAPLSESVKLPKPKKEWYKFDKSENAEIIDEQESSKSTTNTVDSKATISKVQESPSTATSGSIAPPYRERKSQYYGIDKNKTKHIQSIVREQSSFQLYVEHNQYYQKADNGLQNVASMKLVQSKDEESDPIAIPSFQSFFQGIEGSDSTYFIVDSFTQTNVSFHDNVPVIVPENWHGKVYDSEVEKIEEEVAELLPFIKVPLQPPFGKVDVKSSSAQTEVGWLPAHVGTDILQYIDDDYMHGGTKEGAFSIDKGAGTVNKNEIDLEEAIANLIASIIRKPTEQELEHRKQLKQCLEHNNIDGLYNIFGIEKQSQRKICSKVHGASKTKYDSASKNVKKEPSGRKPSNSIKLLENVEVLESELENLVRKLQEEVKKKKVADQLQFAIKMLALAGDPLADFPDLKRHPVLHRWYEIRRGIKRKLSEKEKVQLMYKSKNIWRYLLNTTSELRSPRCNLTAEQLTEFTWDKRQWLRRKANNLSSQFHHDIQQSLVDDARILYPSMNTDYYASKLNKNLRKVFFTYLPAKENNYYVVRPQKIEEMRKKGN